MGRIQDIGFLLIGVAGIIFALSSAYIEINYMLIHKADWEQMP